MISGKARSYIVSLFAPPQLFGPRDGIFGGVMHDLYNEHKAREFGCSVRDGLLRFFVH
jgi:hypothetical protein